MKVAFSPEQQLVVSCVLAGLNGPDAASPGVESLAESVDWDQATALALRHGVAPLVYRGATSLHLAVPERAGNVLRAGLLNVVAQSNGALRKTLAASLAALSDVGIEPVVLKGAALAHTVYPEPWCRSLSDVDLLVSRADLTRASQALRSRGFVAHDEFSLEFPKVEHHLPPHYLPGSVVAVELHHNLISEPHPFRLDVDGLHARAVRRKLAGTDALIPAAADAVHHTCVHLAFAHRYEVAPLRGLVDVHAITRAAGPEIDWPRFVNAVQAARTAGAVYWPLLLARSWLNAEIPLDVLAALRPGALGHPLLAAFADPTFILDGRAPAGTNQAMLGLARDVSLRGGCPAWVQAGALWHAFFPPPDDVGHLPATVTRERRRYWFYLLNPKRLGRGVTAASRLLTRGSV